MQITDSWRMCQPLLGFDSRAELQRVAIARDPFSLFLWQAGKTAPARRLPGRLRVGVAQLDRAPEIPRPVHRQAPGFPPKKRRTAVTRRRRFESCRPRQPEVTRAPSPGETVARTVPLEQALLSVNDGPVRLPGANAWATSGKAVRIRPPRHHAAREERKPDEFCGTAEAGVGK